MGDALTRLTAGVSVRSLQQMVPDRDRLPPELDQFEPLREGYLDDISPGDRGSPPIVTETLGATGHISAYMKRLVMPISAAALQTGIDVGLTMVVHLFTSRDTVAWWTAEGLHGRFEANVGKPVGPGRALVSVQRLRVGGFYQAATGVKALQQGTRGFLSTTILAFGVGCLLGTVSMESTGDVARLDLTRRVAMEFERQIVRVALAA